MHLQGCQDIFLDLQDNNNIRKKKKLFNLKRIKIDSCNLKSNDKIIYSKEERQIAQTVQQQNKMVLFEIPGEQLKKGNWFHFENCKKNNRSSQQDYNSKFKKMN